MKQLTKLVGLFVPLFLLGSLIFTPRLVLAAPTCNPADTSCTGICTVKPVIPNPQRGTVTDYVLDADNCSQPDYQPNVTVTRGRSNIDGKCNCVPANSSGTPLICTPPSSCISNSQCSSPPNCSSYVCLGYIQGRTPGRCVDGTNLCSKANLTCSTGDDAYCQSGGSGCSQYTCWTLGPKNNACRLGVQPVATQPACSDVDTAIGTIPTCDLNAFARWFIGWAVGIGGGIAFLLILLGGFRIMSSGGNPDQIKAGKEQLTAAITGLLFIIFSVFLLRLIGVQILHIPGF